MNHPPRPVSPGDRVTATGRLESREGSTHLVAVGEGHYDYVLQTAAQLSVVTDLPGTSASSSTVTITAVWTGSSFEDAVFSEPQSPVRLPETLADRIDSRLLPAGRRSKGEILAADVLASADQLRGTCLLSYVARKERDGWIGVASAADAIRVEDALRIYLGDAVVVVSVPWTLRDVTDADAAFVSEPTELLDAGQFVDPEGRLRACVLVRLITPGAAEAIRAMTPGVLEVNSWTKRVD